MEYFNKLMALMASILYMMLLYSKNVGCWRFPGASYLPNFRDLPFVSLFTERFGDWIDRPPEPGTEGVMHVAPPTPQRGTFTRRGGGGYTDYLDFFANALSSDFAPNFRRNYAIFLLAFIALAFYGLAGYQRNKTLAKEWIDTVLPVLDDYFAHVEREPKPYEVRSYHEFDMYATGRTSCKWMFVKLKLVKRQCFWHETLLMLMSPEKDMVTFEVHFESLDCIMFGVVNKLHTKSFVNEHKHLVLFASLYEHKDLPEGFRAYLSDKTLTQFPAYVLHQLQPLMDCLESFHVADSVIKMKSGAYNVKELLSKPVMTVTFVLKKEKHEVEALVKAVMNIADFCKNFVLNQKQRDTILKERSELQAMYTKLYAKEEDSDDEPEMTPEMAKKREEKMARKHKAIGNIKMKKAK